jgi:hypothetical protein
VRFIASVTITTLLMLTALTRADAPTSAPRADATTGIAPAFPRGTYTVSAALGYAAGFGEGDEDVPWLAGGVNYYVFDNLSLGLELGVYRFSQPSDDATTGSLSLVMRHHVFDRGATTVFLDILFGPSWSTEEVPSGGTQFNFLTRTGIGVSHRLDDLIDLLIGVRYFHLSNSSIDGEDRNPSINGMEGYVGVMWRL